MPIVYRLTKGSPLTHEELDGNFQFLTGSINAISGTYAKTGSNTFNGNQTIYGNLSVFGTASFTYTTSSVNQISASTFGINIFSPVVRFGRYDVYDTGSTVSTSSFVWDSTNTRWIYVRTTGSVSSSAVLLTGPLGSSGPGTETVIPQYRIPMSNGNQSLVNSNIYTSGSLNIITGSTRILPFSESLFPSLGTGSGGFFLGGSSGLYGLYMGVSSSGDIWLQSNRNDGSATAYNMLLQPVGGNINIGKFNPGGSGPKLDISGSTIITGSLGVLGNTNINGTLNVTNITSSLLGTASYASQALNANTASLATTASFALTASFASNIPVTSSYALQALNANTLDGLGSSEFITVSGDQNISGNKTINLNYQLSFVGDSVNDTKASIRGGGIDGPTIGDLLFLDNSDNKLAGLYQDGTGFKLISGSFIGDLIGTASLASTASFVNRLNQNLTVVGNQTITGSLNVSGSTSFIGTHTLSGSNTIIGNTVMSGSIVVSGSTRFANSTFTVTGSQFYTGSSDFKGNQTITGSLNLTSGVDSGLFINGQKQFNYISLYHTSSTRPTQNASGSFIYSTTAISSSISVVSGSRITFDNTGIYNLQFSVQLFTQTGATVDIWLKRNGTNIPNTGGKIGPTNNNTYHIPAWNYVDTFTSGSYVEIAYQTNQDNTEFQYIAATGNVPAIPSIIATVTQVA